jgi:hypothetical protein
MAGTIILRGPVGRALARAIELEAGQTRLTELEERVDFAERQLARPDAPVGIPERAEGT